MTNKEVMQMALDALLAWEKESSGYGWSTNDEETVAALRAALEHPEPEPVAYWIKYDEVFTIKDQESGRPLGKDWEPLYTASPNRKWVGLTDEDRNKLHHLIDWTVPLDIKKFADAVEAKLKEKNT